MKGKIFNDNDQEAPSMPIISLISGGFIFIYLHASPELSFWLHNPGLRGVFEGILKMAILSLLFMPPFAIPALLTMFLLGSPIGVLYLLLNKFISKLKKLRK